MLSCVVLKGKLTTCEKVSSLEYFGQKFLLGVGGALSSMSEGVMHFRVSHQSQCGLYQRTNQIACQKIRWYLHSTGDMSVYCTLFSQTFYGLLFCYLTITDVTYLQIIDFQFLSCCTSQPKKT